MSKMLLLITTLIVVVILKLVFKKDSFISKILTPTIQLVSALLLGIILIPLGFLYDVGKSIVELKFVKVPKAIWTLFKEVLLSIFWLVGKVAFAIDLLANAVAGEMIEDIITSEEDTLFRKGDVTISASIGDLKQKVKLNKTGKILDKLLDIIFVEEDHSGNAFKTYQRSNENKQ